MLRLSKITDYGVLILRTMATREGQLISARELADAIQVSLPMVSKILKILVAQHLVDSVRGSNGGYQLNRAPDDISMAQIICALEREMALTECSSHNSTCAMHEQCALKPNWQIVNEVIFTVLSSLTLVDMMNNISTQQLLNRMMECERA